MKPQNEYSNIIDIETIELNLPYTFTINPCDDHQHWKLDTQSRIESCRIFMQHQIDQFSSCPTELFPEVSCKGRIHWHGKIVFKNHDDILKFYISHIPNLLYKSLIEIDTIADNDKWNTYIKKQYKYFGWNIRNYSKKIISNSILTSL